MIKKTMTSFIAIIAMATAGELTVPNGDFERTTVKDGITMPESWTVYKWTKTAAAECTAVKGGVSGEYAIAIRPISPGGIGFISKNIALPENFATIVLTFRIKADADLSKHTPWAFVSWHAKQKFLNKKDAVIGSAQTEWKQVRLTIDRADIPAEADSIAVNLAVQGAADGSGGILYDALALAYTSADTAGAAANPASMIPNAGFESSRAEAGFSAHQPTQWVITRWAAKNDTKALGVSSDEAASGKQSLFITATELGSVGYSSPAVPLAGDFKFLSAEASLKLSSTLNANPWIFITWNKGGAFISRTDIPSVVSKGSWQTISIEVARTDIPKDADSFRINCALLGQKNPAGTLFIDDIIAATSMTRREFKLKPSHEYAWFEDTPVSFTCEDPPEEITAVKGTIYDSSGAEVTEITVDRAAFIRNGWVWRAPAPGYYEIAFGALTANTTRPFVRSFTLRGKDATKRFDRGRYSVAVIKKHSGARSDQFGFDHQSDDNDGMNLASILGFGYMRMWVHWGYHWNKKSIVNPAKGVFQWDGIDRGLEQAERYGMKNNVLTLFGTPQWVSPYPDRTDIDICVARYSVWLPTDISAWTDFINALLGRYKNRISNWELWNEPHLPTGSCFWRDSTSNYVTLVKSGYETIKQLQPNATVWLGGQGGRRYIPFYREFLDSGGFPYYDILSMHGSFPEVKLFWDLEKKRNLTPKPWGATEWHAVLINMSLSGNKLSDEPELCRRMMTDLMQQLKFGAGRIALFEVRNLAEKETLEFAKANGIFTHTSGMFRSQPSIEPRMCGVVIRNFIDRVTDRISYVREYDLGAQKAVLLMSGGKQHLVVWNEGDQPAALDARLAKAYNSIAVTWEGKPWTDRMLDTASMYYLSGFSENALTGIDAPATALLYPLERKKASSDANAPNGTLSPSPIFSDVTGPVSSDAVWNTGDWVFRGINNADRPDGFKARFAAYCGKTGLDIIVDVRDNKFVQNEKPGAAYNGDSIQFALDAEGLGAKGDQTEISVALTANGTVIWKHMSAAIGGDIPQNWTAADREVKYARADIDKSDGRTLYKVHVDWTEFYPFSFDPKKPVRLSVLVNNNDGSGRIGWLGWSGGIGDDKDPSQFGKLNGQ
ncbi:MAG: hypothetical protein AABZ39_12670 [Spirochaetota bacterium]